MEKTCWLCVWWFYWHQQHVMIQFCWTHFSSAREDREKNIQLDWEETNKTSFQLPKYGWSGLVWLGLERRQEMTWSVGLKLLYFSHEKMGKCIKAFAVKTLPDFRPVSLGKANYWQVLIFVWLKYFLSSSSSSYSSAQQIPPGAVLCFALPCLGSDQTELPR